MSMTIHIVARTSLRVSEQADMYSIFARYYDNVDPSRFESDLAEKTWVVHLRNEERHLVGFSTLQVYKHAGPFGEVAVLYSGDTIIDRAYRRNGNLAGAFGHLLLKAVDDHPGMPVYWLLTSKGVRTYRFLPVFFKTFYPVFDRPTPEAVKRLTDSLATEKFGSRYSPLTQVVSHSGRRDWLCAAEHDPMLLRRSDEHIRFFLQRNPGYVKGDELACLAEMSESNLNRGGRRVIQHTEVHWRE